MKQLFSKFLVTFLLTSAVVLSWSEYFYRKVITKVWNFRSKNMHTHTFFRKKASYQ